MVGARSAIFAPVQNLKLIVVDEEHEPAYKQDETPRYHGRDVAVMRAKLAGARLLLGSATPSLESFTNVESGKYRLLQLTQRVDARKLPFIDVVDMRIEAMKQRTLPSLSGRLVRAMQDRLERNGSRRFCSSTAAGIRRRCCARNAGTWRSARIAASR